MRRCGKRVNDLTGAGVVQLLARLMLDGRRIVLQLVDVIAQAAVLRLELLHLDLQFARFLALIQEGGHTVVAEDNAISHYNRERRRAERGQLPARFVQAGAHCSDDCNDTKLCRILLLFAQRPSRQTIWLSIADTREEISQMQQS